MDIINELELKVMVDLEKSKDFIRNDINDESLKTAVLYYYFLNNNIADLILKKDKNCVMYSIYYWYSRCKERYYEIYGFDAGVDQEGFKLLGKLENELDEGIDWSIIQEIEEELK